MPSHRSRSRSPSPYTKRKHRSYAQDNYRDSPPPRRSRYPSRSPSPYTQPAERSPSPRPRTEEKDGSHSPKRRRHDDRPKKLTSGFRWKEKPRHDDDGDDDRRKDDSRRLERGYRVHDRPPRQRSPGGRRDDIEAKFGRQRSPVRSEDGRDGVEENGKGKGKDEKKKKKERPATVTSQEMIIVNVNDRLGTKASIPCLASDPIKLFKAQVAARIGRQPHEIMLKRQGERPFKDHLTLEDYGVSNGVQLDLEIDTGD